MKVRGGKIYEIFWIYVFALLMFVELLGLFFPKIVLRVVYIALMTIALATSIYGNHGRIIVNRLSILIYLYILMLTIRFIIQFTQDDVQSETFIIFAQQTVPTFAYFISLKLDKTQASKIERLLCVFATISILIGILDMLFKFLPRIGAFKADLYGYVSNSVIVLRGYSMAGSALNTGFIGALSALICILSGETYKNKRTQKLVIAFLSLIGCMLSLSRGAIAFFAITIMIYSLEYIKLKKNRFNPQKIALLCGVTLGLIILFIVNYDKISETNIYNRILSVFNMAEGSNAARVNYQIDAIEYIINRPLFGYGFGYTGYQAALNDKIGFVNTESYILSLLIEGGIILLLFFLCIVIGSTVIARKNRTRDNLKYFAIILGIFAWSIMYILLDSDLNLMVFWYCIGRLETRRDNLAFYDNTLQNFDIKRGFYNEENVVLYACGVELDQATSSFYS